MAQTGLAFRGCRRKGALTHNLSVEIDALRISAYRVDCPDSIPAAPVDSKEKVAAPLELLTCERSVHASRAGKTPQPAEREELNRPIGIFADERFDAIRDSSRARPARR